MVGGGEIVEDDSLVSGETTFINVEKSEDGQPEHAVEYSKHDVTEGDVYQRLAYLIFVYAHYETSTPKQEVRQISTVQGELCLLRAEIKRAAEDGRITVTTPLRNSLFRPEFSSDYSKHASSFDELHDLKDDTIERVRTLLGNAQHAVSSGAALGQQVLLSDVALQPDRQVVVRQDLSLFLGKLQSQLGKVTQDLHVKYEAGEVKATDYLSSLIQTVSVVQKDQDLRFRKTEIENQGRHIQQTDANQKELIKQGERKLGNQKEKLQQGDRKLLIQQEKLKQMERELANQKEQLQQGEQQLSIQQKKIEQGERDFQLKKNKHNDTLLQRQRNQVFIAYIAMFAIVFSLSELDGVLTYAKEWIVVDTSGTCSKVSGNCGITSLGVCISTVLGCVAWTLLALGWISLCVVIMYFTPRDYHHVGYVLMLIHVVWLLGWTKLFLSIASLGWILPDVVSKMKNLPFVEKRSPVWKNCIYLLLNLLLWGLPLIVMFPSLCSEAFTSNLKRVLTRNGEHSEL